VVAAGVKPESNAIIGTVEGDLHDIGKNLVATMWRGTNMEVIDLGVNVAPAGFVAAVRPQTLQAAMDDMPESESEFIAQQLAAADRSRFLPEEYGL
jgi:methanogenic corrinoid protein MtbC1